MMRWPSSKWEQIRAEGIIEGKQILCCDHHRCCSTSDATGRCQRGADLVWWSSTIWSTRSSAEVVANREAAPVCSTSSIRWKLQCRWHSLEGKGER